MKTIEMLIIFFYSLFVISMIQLRYCKIAINTYFFTNSMGYFKSVCEKKDSVSQKNFICVKI